MTRHRSEDHISDDAVGPAGPTNPIDPRLRARRVEVARARGRRRHRLLLLSVVVLTVLTGAWLVAYRSPLLDVDHVTVRGSARTEAAALRRATGVSTDTALLGVDLGAVRRRVEAQPWVDRATVVRRWPGTLQVTVTERTPVAVVGDPSVAVVVDETGRVLGPARRAGVARRGAGLPRLRAAAAPAGQRLAPSSRRIAGVLGELPGPVRAQIARAAGPKGDLTFTLTDGVTVRWGAATATGDKARSLLLLLAKADRTTIAAIDVSVPSAAALTRKDGPVA